MVLLPTGRDPSLGSSESELINQIKSGSRQAFNILVDRYAPFAYRLAYSILQNEQDAQDAVQEAFLSCFVNISSFRQKSSFQTWLYRIVANRCTDILRKKQRDNRLYVGISADSLGTERMEALEESMDLKKFLVSIAPEYRAVIVLYYGFDFKTTEVAETLGIPVGTVKSRLSTARKLVQQRLGEVKRYGM